MYGQDAPPPGQSNPPQYGAPPPPQYQSPPPQYGPPPQYQGGPPPRAAAPAQSASFLASPGIERSRWENLTTMALRLVAWIALVFLLIGAIFALVLSFMDNPTGTPASFILTKLGNAAHELLWAVLLWAFFMGLASVVDSLIMIRKGAGKP